MWTPERIPDQRGRVALVTGASSGLGLEVTRALARRGALVLMAARHRERLEAARATIAAEVPEARLEVHELDLGRLDAVRSCAGALVAAHARLDLLVNNAGVMGVPEGTTADGFETQLGVNHLGHFVLTRRLLPALLRGRGARVVSVTSFARLAGRRVSPSDPHLRGRYGPWRAYNRSKLANVHFALELQRRLEAAGAGVASLAAHPGLAYTDLQARSVRETAGGWSQRFFAAMARTVGMPPERGAHALLRAATDPDARGGDLYGPRWLTTGPAVRRPLARAPRRRATERLWEVSERETGERFDVAELLRGAREA